MKKRLLLGVAFVVVAGLAVMGSAAAGSAPKNDKVSGDGQRAARVPGGSSPLFTIDAKSGPAGQNPKGTVTFDWGTSLGDPTSYTVNVTCLNVSGNQATIVGFITSGTGVDVAPGNGFMVVVQDNGVPKKGGISPDRMSGVSWGATVFDGTTPEAVCADPTILLGDPFTFVGLVSGNINVTDAT